MACREMTRSPSASTLSCITVREDDGDVSSVAPSTTPPTSNTDDASSASTHATRKPETHSTRSSSSTEIRRAGRAQDRSRSNEHQLSSRGWQQTGGEGGSRTVSGETLVEHVNGAEQRLVRESIQMLDLKWKVDAMPGYETKKIGPANGMKRRKSTRLELLERATSMVNVATTALGKRGREARDVGREKLQALKGDRRASLRPRGNEVQHEPSFEGPLKKRARLETDEMSKAETTTSPTPRKFVPKPKSKRWLSQGLYIGQDRDFDPRFTEAKNKLKKASKSSEVTKQNAVLPLPMFAGQRLLDLGRVFKLPFGVFSPLPPGQPKPEEWKRTQKSMSFKPPVGL